MILILNQRQSFFLKRTHYIALFFSLFISYNAIGQKTLAEKLGYPKDAKLLIIHADDLGVSHSENAASIKALDSGAVNSASIMMPTPWVEEIAAYARKNKGKHDLGIHLVLTSEWKNYKWGPVASTNKVSTLVNKKGYFYKECPSKANLKEIETELKAQIDLAYTMGITPTHLDSHMGCLFWTNKSIFKIYVQLAKAYKLPCLIDQSFAALFTDKEEFQVFLKEQEVAVLVDYNLTISPEDYKEGTAAYYTKTLKNLKPGLSQFLIHTAYDSDEMQAITIDHPDWGSKWRQADFDYFMSASYKQLLKQENIKLVTWREISKALKSN